MSPPAESAAPPPPIPPTERVRDHPLEREMHRSYIDYAMSVIIGRALPVQPGWAEAGPPEDPVVDVGVRRDARQGVPQVGAHGR